MSHKKGFEITCDRCGVKTFEPQTNEVTLGVPIPDGWTYENALCAHLCPACAHQWEANKKAFLACEALTIFPPTKTHTEETQ